MTRRLPRLGAGLAVLLVALVLAAPAGAHGPVGTMGIEVVPGSAPLTAQVRVLLEYANDREVVPGATVTATATAADSTGATVGPVPLTDRGEGRYEVLLTLSAPGPWSVAVTSADPAATAEASVTATSTAAPVTSSGTIAGDLGRPDDTGDERVSGARRTGGSSDGPSPVLLIAIAVGLAAVGAVTFTIVRRRVSRPGS